MPGTLPVEESDQLGYRLNMRLTSRVLVGRACYFRFFLKNSLSESNGISLTRSYKST